MEKLLLVEVTLDGDYDVNNLGSEQRSFQSALMCILFLDALQMPILHCILEQDELSCCSIFMLNFRDLFPGVSKPH